MKLMTNFWALHCYLIILLQVNFLNSLSPTIESAVWTRPSLTDSCTNSQQETTIRKKFLLAVLNLIASFTCFTHKCDTDGNSEGWIIAPFCNRFRSYWIEHHQEQWCENPPHLTSLYQPRTWNPPASVFYAANQYTLSSLKWPDCCLFFHLHVAYLSVLFCLIAVVLYL